MSTATWVTRRKRGSGALKYTILAIIALPWTVMPVWMLMVNSFKTESDSSVPSLALPTTWNIVENYTTVFTEGNYLTGLRNSLVVAVPTILVVLLLGSMAAWAFARSTRMTLRGAYYLMAMSIILPPAIVPTVFLVTHLGLTGGVAGYMLALIGTRLGVVAFLATGYIRGLPIDFEEAAEIDGAGRWQIYWHVILPLLRPILFTVAVMTMINVWNDFFFALYMLKGTDNATLPLSLYNFANSGQYGVRRNLVFAHVLLTSLPLLIAYIFLQKRVLSGLTEGGVTG
jgi:raffinose/stachyose/melibiose transport system permease protein